MQEIQVFDDVFNQQFIKELHDICIGIPLRSGNIANRLDPKYGGKGSHNLLGCNLFVKQSPYIYESICPLPIMRALEHIADNVIKKKFELTNIDMNAQVMSMNGTTHTDGNDYTILLMPNSEWNSEWGGQLEFLENDEVVGSVPYMSGRVVFFKGDIPHRGLAPIVPYVYRFSIAYRVKLIS